MNSIEKTANKTFSDNPLWNLLLNVILPVIILKKGSQYLPTFTPLAILLIAIAIPILVGTWDYLSAKKRNYVSLLGIANTALTGGLALASAEGFWFAVKEGSLPFLLGVAVFVSARYQKNFVRAFLLQPQVINVGLIEKKAQDLGRADEITRITKLGSLWFSLSFFVSAALNLILGLIIFKPIDPGLEELTRAQLLNDQIAEMTWMGYIVIALPLTLGTGFLLWWVMRSLSKTLELKMEDLLHQS